MHFYYILSGSSSCYMIDNSPVGEAMGSSSGGSMCDGSLEYSIDLIFSDENYQWAWLGGWALLGWERGTEEPAEEHGGVEIEECVPTHGSGEVLLIYGHPFGADWEGKWCRDSEDWNEREHFVNLIPDQHFYYFYATE